MNKGNGNNKQHSNLQTDNYFKKTLLTSVQTRLNKPSLSPRTSNKVIKLYNSIDPSIFKHKKATDVLPVLSKVIAQKIVEDNTKTNVLSKTNDDSNKTTNEYNDTNQLVHDNQLQLYSSHKLDKPHPHDKPQNVNPDSTYDDPQTIRDTLKDLVGTPDTTDSRYISSYIGETEPQPKEVKDLEINSFLGINDLPTLQLLFNPESLYVHQYLVLDTDYRSKANEESTTKKFTWDYSYGRVFQTGFCYSTGRIRDVIGMRMYQPRVHYLAGMASSSNRVSVLIEEFSAQAFIGENNRRFHFLLRPVLPASTTVELSTEDYNDGIFRFRKPITTFDTMTISFGDPLSELEFPVSPVEFNRFIIAIEFTCYRSDK